MEEQKSNAASSPLEPDEWSAAERGRNERFISYSTVAELTKNIRRNIRNMHRDLEPGEDRDSWLIDYLNHMDTLAQQIEIELVSAANPLDRFVMCLLTLTAKHNVNDELMWTEDLKFAVNCSDAFWWGTADAEEITPDTLPELERALNDGGYEDGMLLYCARRRKMRPQGAMYKYIKKPELFNVFPKRETCIGNPHKPDGT